MSRQSPKSLAGLGPHRQPCAHRGAIGTLRGYSLPFVMGISAMLAFSSFAMIAAVSSGSKTSGDMLRRRRAFYACDGLSRVVTKLSQAYMATTSTPDSAGLDAYITSQGGGPSLPAIAPANFDVTNFQVSTIGASQSSVPLPSGPFRGMNARQDTIELKVEARHQDLNYVCRTEQTVTLGKVALFQFYVFSDTDWDGHPGPQMTLNGRAHINGNACPGGRMRLSRITASGALRHIANSNCAYNSGGTDTEIQKVDNSYSAFTTANDHDTIDWENNALAEWGGNALDEAHDVPVLKPPTVGTPLAQVGANATEAQQESNGVVSAGQSNVGSLRFLIDPVVTGEPNDVREQKLSFLADIRIIDGVWYRNDGSWPGSPIWSDHPGDFTLSNGALNTGTTLAGNQVGQRTVASLAGWGANVPRRFSYYGTLADGYTLQPYRRDFDSTNSVPAVMSYGSVKRQTTTSFNSVYPTVTNNFAIWEPGGWVGPELCRRDYVAGVGTLLTSALSGINIGGALQNLTNPIESRWNSGNFVSPRDTAGGAVACQSITLVPLVLGATTPINAGQVLLNGTRQGFRENHRGGPYTSEGIPDTGNRSQVLPANFDLMAFQAAMADTSPGELGSYFNGGLDFNGIVWMTFTWPNSFRGLNGSTYADVGPMDNQGVSQGLLGGLLRSTTELVTGLVAPGTRRSQGSQAVAPVFVGGAFGGAAFQNNGAASQRELPFPLCSLDSSITNVPGGRVMAGGPSALTNDRTDGEFIVPDCNKYDANKGGRVTAVRVLNGRDLDPEMFPRGLTVATNLPIFVLGDMNTKSVPMNDAVLPQPAGSRTWIPLLLAGDVMYHASNAWDDQRSPWSIRSESGQRQATSTTYNISELIGWVPSSNGDGGTRFHNLQGFQERWGAVNHNINGSVAIGWRAVYFRNNRTSGGSFAYQPPIRNWTFDTNYRLFSNQPPGTPTFDVAATKKFARDSVD